MLERGLPPSLAEPGALRMVFETSSDAILLAEGLTRDIVDANPAASRMFGYTHEELLGLRSVDLMHPESLELYARVAGDEHERLVVVGRRKDGSPIDIEIWARNAVQDGRPVRCVVVREVVERSRAFELLEARVGQRTRELAALLELSRAVSGTLESQPLLELVLDQLDKLIGYNQAAIWSLEGNELRMCASRGPRSNPQADAQRQPLELSPVFQAARERRGPVIISDLEGDTELARSVRAVAERRGFVRRAVRSALGVPLIAKDAVVGLLWLDHPRIGFYTTAHADLAFAVANQVAVALENARLYEEAQRQRRDVEVLYRGQAALNGTLEPRLVLDALVEVASELLEADKTSALVWDANREHLTVQAERGFDPDTLREMSYRVGEGLSTLAAESGEIVATSDAQTDPRVSERLRAIDVAEGIHAMLSVPIKLGSHTYGVFNVQYARPRPFSAEDRRLVDALACSAAVALQNAELFQAERATRERLDVALAAGRMGTCEWDTRSNQITWSAQLGAIHGLPPSECGCRLEDYVASIHPEDRERFLEAIRSSLAGGEHHLEYRVVQPDGSTHWVEASGRGVRDADGNIVGLRSVCQEVTARKAAEAESIRLQQRERAASEARAALEERQRLARELHDSVSQALYAISLGVQTALGALDDDHRVDAAIEPLAYVHRLAEAAIAEMRALIFELRPESLAQEGLVAALQRHAASLRARHALGVEVSVGAEPDLDLEAKEAVYRIAQESMHNAVRHAHATCLRVSLQPAEDRLVLEVCDDGAGFDPTAAYPGHLGLVSMRERAAAVGAHLDIESAPSQGTRVRLEVPTGGGAIRTEPAARPPRAARPD